VAEQDDGIFKVCRQIPTGWIDRVAHPIHGTVREDETDDAPVAINRAQNARLRVSHSAPSLKKYRLRLGPKRRSRSTTAALLFAPVVSGMVTNSNSRKPPATTNEFL
jgi:hypothetical protein